MQDYKQNKQLPKDNNNSHNQRFDSETFETSKKESNNSKNNIEYEKSQNKSIDFYPKVINIEKIDKSIGIYRKYTVENELIIKDFVPQLKPIKMHLVPSKLYLNRNRYNNYKYNINNIYSNNIFTSCPNSEDDDEDDSDKFESTSKKFLYLEPMKTKNIYKENNIDEKILINIKEIRKNLRKAKSKKIQKIFSQNDFGIKKLNDKMFNADNSTDSDLYDIDEIENYSMLKYKDDNQKEEEKDELNNEKIYRNRTNSFSILEMLQKKYKTDNNL